MCLESQQSIVLGLVCFNRGLPRAMVACDFGLLGLSGGLLAPSFRLRFGGRRMFSVVFCWGSLRPAGPGSPRCKVQLSKQGLRDPS